MKLTHALLCLPLLAAGAFAARARFQEGMPPTPKPGPEHELLKHLVGTWNAEIAMGSTTDTGTTTTTLGMNGLWVTSDFVGSMMGGQFLGHEVMGWDPDKKKYVACWVDSMSTALTLTEGTWDEATKTMTMESLEPDPMSGAKMVNVTKIESPDRHVFTMHMGAAASPAMMTITYTRKK